jgi:signal transduction histidine kinase
MAGGFRRAWQGTASRLRRQLGVVAPRPQGRLTAEIVLALAVGVAAFVLVAVAGAAARSHMPDVLFGVLLLLVVLAVARYGGILYALPVGVATILAFDWYVLPPLRKLDAPTVLELGLFLVLAVIVGVLAANAGRRATGLEEARGLLAEEQAALRRVATLVAGHRAPAEVFAAVTEEAGRLLDLDSAHLLAYERDETATVVGSWSLQDVVTPVGTQLPLEGDNVLTRVFRTQRPARIDYYTDDAGDLVTGYVRAMGVRATVGAPILVEGRIWGAMNVASSRPEPVPAGTELRVEAFTKLVALAIANAEARKELEHVAAEQAALGRVATLVAEAVPPDEIFAAVAAEAAGLFHVSLVRLYRYEAEGVAALIASAGELARDPRRKLTFPADDRSIVASVQQTGRARRVDDYSQLASAGSDVMRELGITMAAGVPVIVSGSVWGTLILAAGNDRPPLPVDVLGRLEKFTELVATAIANSAARTEIERLAQAQAALRRVATLVARGAQTREVFAAVAHEVSEVMHLPIAAVLRFDEDEAMTVVAARSDRPHPFEPGTRHPFPPDGVGVRVRLTGRPARSQDYENRRDAFGAKAREVGLRSIVAAPIVVNGAVWGLVVIGSTAGPVPDDAEDRLAEFTELLGAAVANTESRAELSASRARVVAAADETRRRLERDLHDGIQQRLVTLALKARTIETMVPRPADEIQCELSVLADGIGTSLDELREVSRGIHPAVLSEAGLGPALKALARRSAVPVQLHLALRCQLAEHLEVAAYYIASEALTNAAKHAQATVVDMRVDGLDDALSLCIRDDGIGGADLGRGSGIIGLKDRVDALGGIISVLSPPGRGTTLSVQLPASPPRAQPHARA